MNLGQFLKFCEVRTFVLTFWPFIKSSPFKFNMLRLLFIPTFGHTGRLVN